MPIATTNPATGETVRTFEALTADELEARLAKAADTFATYRRTPMSQARSGSTPPPISWRPKRTRSAP